jgi:hypothetical protein
MHIELPGRLRAAISIHHPATPAWCHAAAILIWGGIDPKIQEIIMNNIQSERREIQ